MFKLISDKVASNFQQMVQSGSKLFKLAIDKESLWNAYLSGFPDAGVRQSYNCNNCRSFITKYAGIVTLDPQTFEIKHMFEGVDSVIALDSELLSDGMSNALSNVVSYLKTRPLYTLALFQFDPKEAVGGVPYNIGALSGIRWNHFHISIPSANIVTSTGGDTSAAAQRGRFESKVSTLSRCLSEFSVDDTELILELISNGSLYRGVEFKPMLDAFLKVQKEYSKLNGNAQNWLYLAATTLPDSITNIRNTAIGTLLQDIAAGVDLEVAVVKYEKVVAPTNYKRTTTLATPRMREEAKADLEANGLTNALNRRFAVLGDVNVNDVLFTYTPTASVVQDVFDQLSSETAINPRSISGVEDVSVSDFISKILPTARRVQALVETRHRSNLLSILTEQVETPRLFKWDNPFSWSYIGGITDAIKERVKAAGGGVEGLLRVSLAWKNADDLDLHITEPDGGHIYYGQKQLTRGGGALDVDMNAGSVDNSTNPVENVIYPFGAKMQNGKYRVTVNNFTKRTSSNQGYTVQVEFDGQIFEFKSDRNVDKHVVEIKHENGTFTIANADSKLTAVTSEKIWGIETFKLTDVTNIMLSPNHWNGESKGNKHYIFTLSGCVSEEKPRPFFNEFLKEEMTKHRKTFEMLAGAITVADEPNQLSGLGFSETLRNDLIVKVSGRFDRYLRIKF